MTMRSLPLLLLLSATPVLAQPPAATTPTAPSPKARILKHEIDELVEQLVPRANADGSLGDGSCLSTAKALTALGHCHRFFSAGDGPWIQRAIHSMFTHRKANGAFVDDNRIGAEGAGLETTRWVLGALEVMDPKMFADDISALRSMLRDHDVEAWSPFRDRLMELERKVAGADDRIAALQQEGRAALQQLGDDEDAEPGAIVDALVGLVAAEALARGDVPQPQDASTATWSQVQQRGFDFLLKQQENGAFMVQRGDQSVAHVGLTGLAVAALETKPRMLRSEPEQKVIEQGLGWLLEQQNDDGSFGKNDLNYTTCASVMALSSADDPRYRQALDKAQHYILLLQNIEGRGYAPSDRDYGSMGYGDDQRGDLSNTQFALDALRRTGLDPQNEAFQKALVFLQRTQNLQKYNDFSKRVRSSEDGSWYETKPGNDGGAVYYPGNSAAGYIQLADGTRIPRSYGSMTYALLKAYVLCGLPADDPRLAAVVDWAREHWTLDVNPGVDPELGPKAPYQGLFYYYTAMAQALDVLGVDEIDVKGAPKVDWRSQLRDHLADTQREDGSWINGENGRWWEDMPLLCTAYSLLALGRTAP